MSDTVKKEVESVNSFTDARKVQLLRERILWLNTLDPSNEDIFSLAREKGIL